MASLFRRFTDTDVYGTAVPLKYEKLATKYPWIYGYFLQCSETIGIGKTTGDMNAKRRD